MDLRGNMQMTRFLNIVYECTYMGSRKMVLMNRFAGQG